MNSLTWYFTNLVISNVGSGTFAPGNVDSKAFVISMNRVLNLQENRQHSKKLHANWELPVWVSRFLIQVEFVCDTDY